MSYIAKLAKELRSQLEAAVLATRSEIGIYAAGLINTAVRWECHARLCQRCLRSEKDAALAVKLELSRDIAKASERRDACFKLLGLDRAGGSSDPWAQIRDATPHLPAGFQGDDGDQSDPAATEASADAAAGEPATPATNATRSTEAESEGGLAIGH